MRGEKFGFGKCVKFNMANAARGKRTLDAFRLASAVEHMVDRGMEDWRFLPGEVVVVPVLNQVY